MPTGPPTLRRQSHEVGFENDDTPGSQQQLSVESPSSTDSSSSSELIVRVCGNYFSIYKTQDGQRIWSLGVPAGYRGGHVVVKLAHYVFDADSGALHGLTQDILTNIQVDSGFIDFMNRTEPAEDTWEQGGSRLCINRSTLIRSMLRELVSGNPQLRLRIASVKFGEGLREPSEAETSDVLQNFKKMWDGVESTPRSFRKTKRKSKRNVESDMEDEEYPASTAHAVSPIKNMRKSTRKAPGRVSSEQVEEFEETLPIVKAETPINMAPQVAPQPLHRMTAPPPKTPIAREVISLDSDDDVVSLPTPQTAENINGGGTAMPTSASAQPARKRIKVEGRNDVGVASDARQSRLDSATFDEQIAIDKARKRARLELNEQEAEANLKWIHAKQEKMDFEDGG
ncbi:hypothetical protein LTR27_001012 [Elasticomyces elasticus]|nr:hypothetical protein LTR27_001012 [Elasticomyces elasticus]